MTQQELQALAMGRAFNGTAATPAPGGQQVVIVDNQGTNDCIPCDDGAGCSLGQTTAVTLDYSQFKTQGGPKLRWSVVSTATRDENIVLLGGFARYNEDSYTTQVQAVISPSIFTGGVSINGDTSARPVSQLNLAYGEGGYVLARVIIRFDNTVTANAPLDSEELIAFGVPADSNNTVCKTVIYEPFCDYCVTTNSGNNTTHAYTLTAVIDIRQGLVIPVPAGSSFTVELCFGLISIPNHQADRAGNQWNAC